VKEVVFEQAGILGEVIRSEQKSHLVYDSGKGKRAYQFLFLIEHFYPV
tara:strand:+ start:735 stop:878 length:144 start_codon:yes stop_codon:yes gene_type:complete